MDARGAGSQKAELPFSGERVAVLLHVPPAWEAVQIGPRKPVVRRRPVLLQGVLVDGRRVPGTVGEPVTGEFAVQLSHEPVTVDFRQDGGGRDRDRPLVRLDLAPNPPGPAEEIV